jgi:predicted ABC-type ATPase
MHKNLYVIAGCNGAGKTTASYTILPEILNCKSFVNADEIARGLSPFQPETVDMAAGRLMLKRISELLHNNENFAFETTLASKSYKNTILIKNLFDIYIPISDVVLLFDNSGNVCELIAKKEEFLSVEILNPSKFNQLKEYYYGNEREK